MLAPKHKTDLLTLLPEEGVVEWVVGVMDRVVVIIDGVTTLFVMLVVLGEAQRVSRGTLAVEGGLPLSTLCFLWGLLGRAGGLWDAFLCILLSIKVFGGNIVNSC